MTARSAKQLAEKGLKAIKATEDDLFGSYLAEDIVNYATGEIYLEAGDEIDEKVLKTLLDTGVEEINVLDIDHVNIGAYIRNTLAVDKNESRQEALFDIYRVMRRVSRRQWTRLKPCSIRCSSIRNAMTFLLLVA